MDQYNMIQVQYRKRSVSRFKRQLKIVSLNIPDECFEDGTSTCLSWETMNDMQKNILSFTFEIRKVNEELADNRQKARKEIWIGICVAVLLINLVVIMVVVITVCYELINVLLGEFLSCTPPFTGRPPLPPPLAPSSSSCRPKP